MTGILIACSSATPAPTPAATQATPTVSPPEKDVSTAIIVSEPNDIFLESSAPRQAVKADTIQGFPLAVTHNLASPLEVNVQIETTQGAAWKAALCFEDQCFLHDGVQTKECSLVLNSGDKTDFELKIFVPDTAQPGDEKTMMLQFSTTSNLEASDTIALTAYVP